MMRDEGFGTQMVVSIGNLMKSWSCHESRKSIVPGFLVSPFLRICLVNETARNPDGWITGFF